MVKLSFDNMVKWWERREDCKRSTPELEISYMHKSERDKVAYPSSDRKIAISSGPPNAPEFLYDNQNGDCYILLYDADEEPTKNGMLPPKQSRILKGGTLIVASLIIIFIRMHSSGKYSRHCGNRRFL